MSEKLFKLAGKFQDKLEQIKQAQESDAELIKIHKELTAVVNGFLERNPIKMTATNIMHVKPEVKNEQGVTTKKAEISTGFVIKQTDYNEYLKKLNNEIMKFRKVYPKANIWAYYDINSGYKADL